MKNESKKVSLLGKVKSAAASVKQVDMFGKTVHFLIDGEEV